MEMVLAFWVSGCAGLMLAQDEGTNKTVVTSDRLTYDYKKSLATFEGNVVVIDPRMTIESDEMRLVFNSTNSIKSATATGKVRMKSEDKTATCDRAVYLAENEEVTLTGNARLNRGRDTTTGNRIVFYLDEDRVVVEGETRLVVFPEDGGKPKLPKGPKEPKAPAPPKR
jgi:lipopolysaccharide export system protein LptA